jgi:FkbM family methyltransferase
VIDYSQGGEQAAILAACNKADGSFLDIGAWCPKALSNTRALYELGWSGVMIEPSPGPVKALIEEYGKDPKIKVIAGAVGLDRHMVRMTVSDDALTTSELPNVERWKETGGFYGEFWVPQFTLGEILFQFGGFDFVNIDTEGTSFAIFKELLATQMRPRCICVEHDGKMLEVSMAATSAGYKLAFVTGENAVFSR